MIPYAATPQAPRLSSAVVRSALAREHDILILEDDLYHYLYFGPAESRHPILIPLERSTTTAAAAGHPIGRILRMELVSGSAGVRIGFVSSPTQLLRAIEAHPGIINLQPPGLTQAILIALLSSCDCKWGHLRHVDIRVSGVYRANLNRDAFDAAPCRHLGDVAMVERSTAPSGVVLLVSAAAAAGRRSGRVCEDQGVAFERVCCGWEGAGVCVCGRGCVQFVGCGR
ncbi:Aminotran-1-2 domain-containing protein [Mycena chlorophos]|uniref:Aminotran-1-2 domain-containing protein n=1 Tax=Mycena chlorophos TaxID=658473 RepID=A0A8H6W715_MYCCL|nr:Aminotran-1-2 domain-containing protein [Mycena chlorophos]